jgi:cell division protein FtsN
MLQAGAFKSPEEAEAMRARLGMLGMDARVIERQAEAGGGGKLYRVRLGPYGRVEDVDKIRKVLTENGIQAQLVKMR